jgi:gluconolactonase
VLTVQDLSFEEDAGLMGDFDILDPRFASAIKTNGRVLRLHGGCRWCEGPAYFPAGDGDVPENREPLSDPFVVVCKDSGVGAFEARFEEHRADLLENSCRTYCCPYDTTTALWRLAPECPI